MKLIDSQTLLNLAKSFAGEAMARTRYEFVEYGARNEGYKSIADIIDTVAYQEFNHARMIYTFIESADSGIIQNIEISSGFPFKEKWNLVENLKLAAEDEESEAKVYEQYAKTAEKEGFKDIAGLFKNMAKVELNHKELFLNLHEQLKNGTLYKKPSSTVWKCAACGYESTGKEPPEKCPLCQTEKGSVLLKL